PFEASLRGDAEATELLAPRAAAAPPVPRRLGRGFTGICAGRPRRRADPPRSSAVADVEELADFLDRPSALALVGGENAVAQAPRCDLDRVAEVEIRVRPLAVPRRDPRVGLSIETPLVRIARPAVFQQVD